MSSEVGFNEPCPCGSGEKYKKCCGEDAAIVAAQARNKIIAGVALVVGAAATFIYLYRSEVAAVKASSIPEDAVFDEEHRHWHTADGVELRLPDKIWDEKKQQFIDAPKAVGGFTPQPEGEVPPGKVWSMEHGHWHDITPNFDDGPANPVVLYPEPPGEAPEGEVWSPEHNHYHKIN